MGKKDTNWGTLRNEITKEIPNDLARKWISDDYFDLIIWYTADKKSFQGFELCYEKNTRKESALTWTADGGFTHSRVNSGEDGPGRKKSPILISGGVFDLESIRRRFEKRGSNLDPKVRDFVLGKLDLLRIPTK